MMAKDRLRRQLHREDPSQQMTNAQRGSLLSARLAVFLRSRSIRRFGSFMALDSEISLSDLPKILPDVECCYPRVNGPDLQFFLVESQAQLEMGSFGILEPKTQACQQVALSDVDMLVVPGLAFDRQGRRLGRGRGYYDRALKNFHGLKVGICPNHRLLTEVPTEPHDISMDFIATESFILRPLRAITKRWN